MLLSRIRLALGSFPGFAWVIGLDMDVNGHKLDLCQGDMHGLLLKLLLATETPPLHLERRALTAAILVVPPHLGKDEEGLRRSWHALRKGLRAFVKTANGERSACERSCAEYFASHNGRVASHNHLRFSATWKWLFRFRRSSATLTRQMLIKSITLIAPIGNCKQLDSLTA